MITIEGKQYPNTKEFAEMTGIPEGTLRDIVKENPELTLKFKRNRLWNTEKFNNEFRKSRFNSHSNDKKTGQLKVAK